MKTRIDYACRELVEAVTDYLEGRLDAADRAAFEDHVARCSGCRTYLEQMRETIRLAARTENPPLSPGQQADLVRLFRGWKRR